MGIKTCCGFAEHLPALAICNTSDRLGPVLFLLRGEFDVRGATAIARASRSSGGIVEVGIQAEGTSGGFTARKNQWNAKSTYFLQHRRYAVIAARSVH